METYNRTTEKGMIESLGLSRWIQPYSDEDEFTNNKNTIVLMTTVSDGLKRYYEYVLKSMEEACDDIFICRDASQIGKCLSIYNQHLEEIPRFPFDRVKMIFEKNVVFWPVFITFFILGTLSLYVSYFKKH